MFLATFINYLFYLYPIKYKDIFTTYKLMNQMCINIINITIMLNIIKDTKI